MMPVKILAGELQVAVRSSPFAFRQSGEKQVSPLGLESSIGMAVLRTNALNAAVTSEQRNAKSGSR